MCAFVDRYRDEHGVEPICKALQIAPGTYYARRSRPESARAVSGREPGERSRASMLGTTGSYGARKVRKERADRTSRRRV
jgi:putative transposase